ncbi:hypothetical protein TNCV_4955681 [Trichonephila clavipes]|nr:hypothetical protein TNCV_4955681 [Trichonephila clavipes]
MGSQPESIITLPASNQRAASKLSAMPKNLNISHPDEARLPRLPDSIDQPITAMPQSRIRPKINRSIVRSGYLKETLEDLQEGRNAFLGFLTPNRHMIINNDQKLKDQQ